MNTKQTLETSHKSKLFLKFDVLAFLILGSFVLWILRHFQDPPGVNGFFYLKQLTVFGENLEFYFRDYSISVIFISFIYKLTHDALFSFQVGVAGFVGLFGYATHLVVSRILNLNAQPQNNSKMVLAVIVSVSLVMSRPFLEFSFSFYKTLVGITFLIYAIYFLVRALMDKTRSSGFVFIGFCILAALSHKTILFFISVLGFSYIVNYFSKKNIAVVGLGILSGLVIFFIFFKNGGAYLNHVLLDSWGSPQDELKWWIKMWQARNYICLGLPLTIAFAWDYFYLKNRAVILPSHRLVFDFVLCVSILTWLPIYRAGESELIYRIMLVQISVGLPIILAYFWSLRDEAKATYGFIFGALAIQALVARPIDSVYYNYSRFNSNISKIASKLKFGDQLICHHGLEFYVDYMTGIRCQSFVPVLNKNEDELPVQSGEIFRLAYVPYGQKWAQARESVIEKSEEKLGERYYLVKEEVWRKIISENKLRTNWKNPNELRPAFIYNPF